MDTQLKQRLTGAIVLVVLAVLIVPELLTGPKERAPSGPTSSDSAPIRSYTIDLTGAKPPSVTRETAVSGTPADAAVAPNAAAPARPPPLVKPASAEAPAAAVRPAAVAAAPASSAAPAVGSASRVSEDSPPLPATPPTVAQGFAIQLGSFANRTTASQLSKELQAAGFRVSIAPVRAGGRELLRVRVGPVGDRAAAEALLKKLSATGHKGPIVPFP